MVVWGTHGTSKSNAELILTQGFKAKPGRIGNGVYFWAMPEDSESCRALGDALAIHWATKARNKRLYEGSQNQEIAIVKVKVDVNEENILGLDDPQLIFPLWHLLNRKLGELIGTPFAGEWGSNKIDALKYEAELHGIIESFISDLEKNYGQPFKIVFKTQSCSGFNDPIAPIIGNYCCFAIRDTDVVNDMAIV